MTEAVFVQVVSYDDIEDSCDIKYIDYGGYDTVAASSLRQIRTDFLSLPFQVSTLSARDNCS